MKLQTPTGIERILIVDDEPKHIAAAQQALEETGLPYALARSVEEAYSVIDSFQKQRGEYAGSEYKIPLVITDLELSDDPVAGLCIAQRSFDRGIPAFIATQRHAGGSHGVITTLIPYGRTFGSKDRVETWSELLKEVTEKASNADVLLHTLSNLCGVFDNGPGASRFIIPEYESQLGIQRKGG